jgi:hypothetical protein
MPLFEEFSITFFLSCTICEHNQVKVHGAQSERTYATTFVSQVQV